MKKSFIILISVLLVISAIIYTGCSSKKAATEPEEATATATQIPAGPSSTPTSTNTPSAVVTPTVIDDFEDGEVNTSKLGSSWTTSADTYGSSITKTAVNELGQTGSYCMRIDANVVNNSGQANWAWTSCAVDVTPSGGTVDFNALTANGYKGIRIKYKGQLGTGSSGVAFLVQLVSNAITDYSKFRYPITAPSANWVTIDIPFKIGTGGFQRPNWGQDSTIDEATFYSQIKAIEFSISDFTSGQAGFANYDNHWWIDDITYY